MGSSVINLGQQKHIKIKKTIKNRTKQKGPKYG